MYRELFIGMTLLQLMILNRYFSVLFHSSNKNKRAIFVSYLLAGGVTYISSISFFPSIITGLMSIGSALLIALVYLARFESKLIFSLLYLILGFISESISFFILSKLQPMPGAYDLSLPENRLWISLFSSLIMFLFILFIRFVKRGRDYKISRVYYIVMTLIILISLFILNTLFFYLEKNPLYILSVVGILFINILIIFLFDRMIEKFRLEDENHQLQRQMEYQDNSYEKTAHSFKSIKRIIHDTNKHLLYIRTCIQEDQFQEAIQHINQTLDQMNVSYQSVATGNLVIDALVSNALNIAYDNQISMKHSIHVVASDIRIDRYDLCIVLGNILDNAIEAARLVPETEDKFINLRIYSNKYTLVVYLVNSRSESANQIRRTLKANPDFHGIGLTTTQRVLEKYGGHLRTNAKAKQYETIVALPFQD